MAIQINGEFCSTAAEAVKLAAAERRKAIYIKGCYVVVTATEFRRLQATGEFMAFLGRVNGQIVTVPIN